MRILPGILDGLGTVSGSGRLTCEAPPSARGVALGTFQLGQHGPRNELVSAPAPNGVVVDRLADPRGAGGTHCTRRRSKSGERWRSFDADADPFWQSLERSSLPNTPMPKWCVGIYLG